MAAILREYDPSVLAKKIIESKLTDKQLTNLGKSKDPEGKGVSLMTWRRLKEGRNVKIDVLCFCCYCMGITPESTFRKVKQES